MCVKAPPRTAPGAQQALVKHELSLAQLGMWETPVEIYKINVRSNIKINLKANQGV